MGRAFCTTTSLLVKSDIHGGQSETNARSQVS